MSIFDPIPPEAEAEIERADVFVRAMEILFTLIGVLGGAALFALAIFCLLSGGIR